MKSIPKILLPVLIFILGGSAVCAQKGNTSIKGNGILTTRSVETGLYEKIQISGPIAVTLVKGKGNIEITAESNVQDRILIERDDKTLVISLKDNTSWVNTKQIQVKVPFLELSNISIRGSGSIKGTDTIETTDLSLYLSGSGEMDLRVKVNNIAMEISGSGEMEIAGIATRAILKSIGSGKLDGEDLFSENANVNISGSSEVKIVAHKSLDGVIRGSGTVRYGGNPPINNIEIRGSGKVKPL